MARKSRKFTENTTPQTGIKKIYNVGAYIRLSAVDKKHKGDSIENQQALISAYIEEYSDLELTETYIDNGISGQTCDRPAFQRMISDLENGNINCCITKDLSRLGRNAIDTGYYIEKFFPTHNIRYIAINDDYDSADANNNLSNSHSATMVSLKNLINEAYALEIGRKIRTTKQMHIRDGYFIGRLAPYGYLKSPTDNHKLVPDEYAADIVRKIFEMSANGQNISMIAGWLNDKEILAPKRYFYSIGLITEKESNGNLYWNKGVVYSILRNRVYIGDMVQGKYTVKNHIQVKLPESEWIIVENTHEGIIDRYLFDEVQKKYGNSKPKANKKSTNMFLRKIYCGYCRHALRRKQNKNSNGFVCTTNIEYSKKICKTVMIDENDLKRTLFEILKKQKKGLNAAPKTSCEAELKSIQAEIERVENLIKHLYESLVCGDITHDDYKEFKETYNSKISHLSERNHQLRSSLQSEITQNSIRHKATENIGTLRCVSDLTAEIIDALVEKIFIFDDNQLEIHFKFTDEIIRTEARKSE